jgi:thiamine kinase-like enzyme
LNDITIIRDIEQLTTERLTRIFKNKGYLSQGKVTKIIKKKSQDTVSSDFHFLELTFSVDTQLISASPEIIVKIPKKDDLFRFIGRQEAKFYNIVAENMIEMPIPTCYDAIFSEETGLSHVILENVSETHEEYVFRNKGYPPSKQYFEKAVDCLAELHAFWWDHKKLPKLKELSKQAKLLNNTHHNYQTKLIPSSFLPSFDKIGKYKGFEAGLQHFLEDFGDKMSEKRKSLLKSIVSLYPQIEYDRIAKKNITIIHNDADFRNFLFPKDMANQQSKPILIDWHDWVVGVGCQDLAYMIGLVLFPDYRRLIEKDLIKRYHNHLIKVSIKNYSWDECWYDYKLFALLNIYQCIWWWMRGINVWEGLENSISTIEDLNCMELLK